MGAQFERYLAEQHPDLKGQAHMFVKEVRKGSIIADLIPRIPDLIGYMDNVLIVGGFGALFSAEVRKLLYGQFLDTSNKSDVAEAGKTLHALSQDKKGDSRQERHVGKECVRPCRHRGARIR